MGLDMYLYKKTYVKNWGHMKPEELHEVTIKVNGDTRSDIKPERVSYITEEVGYWRKFNALHGWFVENYGSGEDNCQELYVGEEGLTELLKVLKEVDGILNKSKKTTKVLQDWNGKDYEVSTYDCEDEISEIFSPTEGFFFGSGEIDDYYKQEVERSITLISDLLKENEESEKYGLSSGDFYYQASW
jgi:hypothetical protein